MFHMTKLCLHKLVELLQPVQVFPVTFSDHVLAKEIANVYFDTPVFQKFKESFLQIPKDIATSMKKKMSICFDYSASKTSVCPKTNPLN